MPITSLSQLEQFKSQDIIDVQCIRCNNIRKTKVASLRYYFKHLSKDGTYVCHKCKVIENAKMIGNKLKIRAREKGYIVTDYIDILCEECKNSFHVRYKNVRNNKKRNNGVYRCNACSMKLAHKTGKFNRIYTDEFKKKLNDESIKFWEDNKETWKSRLVTDEFRKQMSFHGRKAWDIEEYRKKMIETRSTPEFKKKLSEWSRMAWTPEFKEKMIELGKLEGPENGQLGWQERNKGKTEEEISVEMSKYGKMAWTDEFKEKMALVRLQQPKTSFQQKVLYHMLADLGVEYSDDQSTLSKIGYYTFDCRIEPQPGIKLTKPLLIEVQGDYWHNLPRSVAKDKSKATYIKTYFPHLDLKYIWEHEFNNKDRVRDLLKYWLGLDVPQLKNFAFNDVEEKIIDYKDAELFVSAYHYAGRIGRSGINLGYYLGNELIAVVIYAGAVRQETAIKQGYAYKEVLELTRLAIHPSYQVKNFASFIIGKSIKYIRNIHPEIKLLVSFADATYNHSGTIYKASNWKYDGEVKPDYWYADNRGYICHKKTLWNHAKKMIMTESEYCEKNHYSKIWGEKKFRYIYEL